ncbi:MAG: Fic family protein [Solitalea-like symbiont of Acarus siro]
MKKLNELTQREQTNLFSKLRISFTHHSSAIEGISLSFGETQKLLEQGLTAPDKTIYEQLVVLGFADAFDLVVRKAYQDSERLNAGLIKDIHYALFAKSLEVSPERTERPVGAWRTDERKIKGSNVSLSLPKSINQDIENLLYQFNTEMDLQDISKFHIKFERIHPFADGNGRVGRLVMAYQAIRNNYIPPLILNERRKQYLNSFEDSSRMTEYLKECIQESLNIIDNGLNQSQGFKMGL